MAALRGSFHAVGSASSSSIARSVGLGRLDRLLQLAGATLLVLRRAGRPSGLRPGRRRLGALGRPLGVRALLAHAHVLGPAADVGVQRLVLDRDGARADRVEQRAVVRDQQQRAGERLQRRLERLAALEVEVVGRLVEDQHVGAGVDEDRQRQPPALAAGQPVERLLGRLAAEQELAEQRARLVRLEAGGALGRLQHRARAGAAELLGVLGEQPDLHVVAAPQLAGVELALAGRAP